jgi:peptide deformylase
MIITDESVLRTKSELVDVNDVDKINNLLETLDKELKAYKIPGFGLAGIQINIPLRIAKLNKMPLEYLINPSIKDCEDKRIFPNEGCLSFPYKYFNTMRYHQLTLVNYSLEEKQYKEYILEGTEAVVAQHELDHFDGILYTDRRYIKIGRNDPCNCGSGLKYKKCCGR